MIDLDAAPDDYTSYERHLKSRGTKWITSRDDERRLRTLVAGWFKEYRPQFVEALGEIDSILAVDADVEWLRSRCGVRTSSDEVRSVLRRVRRVLTRDLLPAYDTARWTTASMPTSKQDSGSPAASEMADRLADLNPSIAMSYRQALRDLDDETRTTYIGPVAELREVLRVTVHELSPPDDLIIAEPWFKGHEGRPTQAERIRAVLGSKERASPPEKALVIIDEAIGAVGRETYKRASASVHTLASDIEEARRIQGWVEVVLGELIAANRGSEGPT